MGDWLRVGIVGARLSALAGGILVVGLVAPGAAASGLRVVPFPGTPDASVSSSIIFSALAPSDLRSVTVIGSSSGRHAGRLQLLPAGAGTAFVPQARFRPGESVEVEARLSSPRAGTESGVPGSRDLRFSFRVATPVVSLDPAAARSSASPLESPSWMSGTGHGATQSFHSEPDLHPPVVKVTHDPDKASGDMFIGPLNSPQTGPMILNPRGQLIWFDPDGSGENLSVQHYEGQPVLTWWQGTIVGPMVENPSEELIANQSYKTIAVVHAGYGYATDLHDFQLTSRGTAYLDSPVPVQANLESVGGPAKATVMDYVLQEVDVKTGKVLWEWHALGHVPVSDSYMPYSRNEPFYDYFHLNSIQQLPDGNLLISARDTWAVYEISRRTGKVIWTLGGKHSNFKMGPHTNFEWQHDARLYRRTLSLFDDAGYPPEERQSSAKYLKVNLQGRSVSLLRRFTHTPPVLSGSGGAVQTLPNGNVFVDWGNQPQFSEYTPAGRQLLNFRLPLGVGTYRAFRFPWVGQPSTPPALAVLPQPGGQVRAYASWNGATHVTAWRVLGGAKPAHLSPLGGSVSRSGFETSADVSSEPRYFAIEAMGPGGRVLGTSPARADPPHLAVFGSNVFVPASGGDALAPVGCLSSHGCRVEITVRSGGSVLGRSGVLSVPAYRARLLGARLPRTAGRRAVTVTVRDRSGLVLNRRMALIAYTAPGHGPPISPARSGAAQLAEGTAFVSSTGQTGVLTACYSQSRCRLNETLSAAGRVIGHGTAAVGADELAYVRVKLDQAGQRMLSEAHSNRLAASVELGDGGQRRRSRIDLVRYG